MHEIFGGKGFAIPWNYDNAIKSGCTDVAKKMDFSNYWYPALYHQTADGSFTKVKSELRLYYHWDGPDRVMFPQGFKMVVGNPMNRKDDSATNEFTKSLSWYVLNVLSSTLWYHSPSSLMPKLPGHYSRALAATISSAFNHPLYLHLLQQKKP